MINRSMKFFLIGLAISPVLINAIGLASAFVGQFYFGDSTGESDLIFLSYFQPYAPLASFLFAYSLYLLVSIEHSRLIRFFALVAAVGMILTSVYGFLPKDSLSYEVTAILNDTMSVFSLIMGAYILYRQVPEKYSTSERAESSV